MHSRLVYLMGPSGSGKDSLLSYVRNHLTGDDTAVVAHRYITRDAGSSGENHVALSEREFDLRVKAGLFAMHWNSHGLRYGVGIEINHWLALGLTVVVNGSRTYFPNVGYRYPEVYPVRVDVKPDVLRPRLLQRGREESAAIEARLSRADMTDSHFLSGAVIDNNGQIERAGNELLHLIRSLRVAA